MAHKTPDKDIDFILENKQLKKEIEERSQFLRAISHDLATPLTSLQLALQQIRGEENRELIYKSQKALEAITSMIKEIKDYEAVKSGKKILIQQPLTWGQVFEELDFTCNDLAKEKNIIINYPTNLNSELFHSDQTILVYKILSNLLSNAIKFSYHHTQIHIRLKLSGNFYFLTFEDTGIGIPKEILQHIFSFYKKTNRLGTEGEKGTGFGLPIVKSYLELLGGTISIETREESQFPKNHGSSITISVPKT